MSNGKETQRDILIRIDERQKAIKDDITEIKENHQLHLKNHKWFAGFIIGATGTLVAGIKLLWRK